MIQYLVEAIGTFFLVLTIALTGEPIAIAALIAVMVYVGGPISGGHFNPAVSLGVFLRKKINATKLLYYTLSQLVGASVAVLLAEKVFRAPVSVAPGTGVTWMTAFFAEALFTFLLVTVVLHVAVSKKTQGNQYFGLAIGGAVLIGAYAVGSISGGAFNPAVGVAPNLTHFLLDGRGFDLSLFFLYTTGPFTGALAASYIHSLTEDRK